MERPCRPSRLSQQGGGEPPEVEKRPKPAPPPVRSTGNTDQGTLVSLIKLVWNQAKSGLTKLGFFSVRAGTGWATLQPKVWTGSTHPLEGRPSPGQQRGRQAEARSGRVPRPSAAWRQRQSQGGQQARDRFREAEGSLCPHWGWCEVTADCPGYQLQCRHCRNRQVGYRKKHFLELINWLSLFCSSSKRGICDQEHRARIANFGYSSTLRYLQNRMNYLQDTGTVGSVGISTCAD